VNSSRARLLIINLKIPSKEGLQSLRHPDKPYKGSCDLSSNSVLNVLRESPRDDVGSPGEAGGEKRSHGGGLSEKSLSSSTP